MSLLDSNLFTIGLSLFVFIALGALRIINPTKRHKQWVTKSFLLGAGIGPLLVLVTDNLVWLQVITLSNQLLSIFELAMLSGLLWSLVASWLLSLRQLDPSYAVDINWIKVVGIYLALIIGVTVSKMAQISIFPIIVGIAGLISIILSAQQPSILLKSAIAALLFSVLTITIAIVATRLSPAIGSYELLGTTVQLAFPLSGLISLGSLACLAPIASLWWFNQPLHQSK